MPEENQIQPGFQPEIQVNPQIQQNNLVQSQQTNQEVVQQNNVESAEQDLSQNSKPHKSWLNKFLGWIFIFLGLILNGFGIYAIYYQISDGYPIGDIITDSLVWPTLLVGICFIIIGIRNISGMKFLFWIKNLFLSQKTHSSWLVKIVSLLFLLLGIGLIGLGIYGIFETQSDRHYSDYTIRDIIMDSGIFILGPLGIWLIILGILSYRTPNVDIYYHPTRLTKILSGIYRFLGIALIRAGLRNFSLIGTEDLSFLKILYVGGVITLCGILYILLGMLLYNTKSRIHLGFSLLLALILNFIFFRILRTFSDNNGYGIDNDTLESFGNILTSFSLIYFSISTIRWIIKCRKFNKKGIINPKYLDKTPSKKKIGIITTIILISIVIIDLIYGKIQWSRIPEIDDSIFYRDYHQTKLSDDKDALVQLRTFYSGYIDTGSYLSPLDSYYLYEWNSSYYSNDYNKDISWKQHPEECIVVNSGGNEYCGTWAWDKKTLDRVLNNYYHISNNGYMKDFINDDGYLSIDGKKVTVFQFINEYEPEIRSILKELDRITSLDYYLPDDEILDLVPPALQGYARASMVALQYYIYQEDWDMVMFIIKLNYKFVDIFNDSGSFINQLIGIVIQNIVDSNINSYIQIFPKEFREELSKRYSTQIHNKDEIISKMIKGEYVIRNWAKNSNNALGIGENEPSLFQILFHFPFSSKKDTNKLMNYSYYLIWKEYDNYDNTDIINNIFDSYSLYNKYGEYIYRSLMPRLQSVSDRMDRALYNKESLIENLKSGKYDVWFYKLNFEYNENNRIPTYKEINKEAIKEYSDIIKPCFGKDNLNPDNFSFISGPEFGNVCSQVLSKINEQNDDEFGLKGALIDLTQLWIYYNESLVEQNDCRDKIGGHYGEESYICEKMYNEQDEITDLMETSYINLLEILENIESEIKGINIDDYFFIPEGIYDKGNGITNDEFNDTYPSNNLSNTDLDNIKINNNDLSESLNIIKKYSDIINPCFGEDIIDPIPNVGIHHDEFEEICLNTLKELKEQEKDEFGLKDILIEITKSLINYSKFEVKSDACGTEEGKLPRLCNEIFDKEEELIDKVKENYMKLSDILENIENENPGININNYFYIPYEKIYDDGNLLIVTFFVDEEKSKEILNNIRLQESANNN